MIVMGSSIEKVMQLLQGNLASPPPPPARQQAVVASAVRSGDAVPLKNQAEVKKNHPFDASQVLKGLPDCVTG